MAARPTTRDRSDEDEVLYDPLTGLPGRLLQRAHLVQALRRAERNRTQVAVLFLDVDDFSDLRDRLGPEISEQVLVVLAGRIQAALRGTDMTARLDADEFTVVCEDVNEPHDVTLLERRITEAMAAPMRVDGHVVEVRVSCGAALSTGDEGAGQLLNAANRKMMAARQAAERTT